MSKMSIKHLHQCPNFLHKLVILSFLSFVTFGAPDNILEAFNPNYKIKTRTPQSFIVDTDYFIAPPESSSSFLESVFEEDDAGVLVKMRENYDKLIERDEFANNWDVASTGMYKTSKQEDRVEYFNKNILRYLDKRISGEVKNAEEGSTMASVGAVQKALKPNTNVQLSNNVKVKVKAQVLQGYADINVENPYVDYSTSVSFSGEIKMNLQKKFEESRSLASVEYNVNDSNYVTRLDQAITDTWSARLSSTQSQSDIMFSDNSDSRLQFIYSSPFNY